MSGDDRERAILEAFEDLLGERSLHQVSIDDIARGAGISRPTFYFYFASKEAVLLSLFERMLADAQARRGDVLAQLAADPREAIRESLAAFYDVFREHRAVTLAGADAGVSSPEVRHVWAQVMEGWVAETELAIEAERARGAAPDGLPARELATALLHMNDRCFQTALAHHPPALDEDRVVEVLVGIWLAAIYGAGPASFSSR